MFSEKEVKMNNVKEILKKGRKILLLRLRGLNNPYHNREHIKNVVKYLKILLKNLKSDFLTKEEIMLLIECAWRHDDGHCGNTYRQAVFSNEGISNEEYAVDLMERDLKGELDKKYVDFLKRHILATSFGQDNLEKLPNEKWFRSYKPESNSEKLLVLADVMDFTRRWTYWINQGVKFSKESSRKFNGLDDFLKMEIGFIAYVKKIIGDAEYLLSDNFLKKLRKKLEKKKIKIEELMNKNTSNRNHLADRLKLNK